ncbi:unnamed protein product, partial [marine sediment metagenome]
EIAFAAPRTEEMTRIAAGAGGAGIAGVVEGVIVKLAPEMGAAAPILRWGTLLGVPALGVGGALFTRGLLGDLFTGIACGGLGVIGYTLPEMIAPIVERRAPGQIAGGGVKQLPAGIAGAPARAQAQGARVGIEF